MTAPLFYGDYREQESEKFLSDCRDHKWEVKKQIEYLRLSLVYSSPAGHYWFTCNYEDSDATWPEIEREFHARWPQTATHKPIPVIDDEAEREMEKAEQRAEPENARADEGAPDAQDLATSATQNQRTRKKNQSCRARDRERRQLQPESQESLANANQHAIHTGQMTAREHENQGQGATEHEHEPTQTRSRERPEEKTQRPPADVP
ncbi:hypothetical protein JB92DRAFT_3115668 [Gautieria morchelliformis]|nr:hypothetical protein JB92DRAFT_3115668 [Gautieria morchelliformis]